MGALLAPGPQAPEGTWPAAWRDGERAELAALAGLPAMTPALLRALVGDEGPRAAWSAVRAGRAGCAGATTAARFDAARRKRLRLLAPRWQALAEALDPGAAMAAWHRRGLGVLVVGDAAFPAGLARYPAGPPVLFRRGAPCERRPSVTVTGTRSSTTYGERVAAEIAEGLAACGVAVVTSLEPGIDAAARAGASRGSAEGATAFAAGGADLDRPAGAVGALLAGGGRIVADAPFGARPERWRFPRRNRLMAAASDVLVVVEAHGTGGALHGAEAALELGTPVCAVPGSVRSPSSRGTNALIADGAHVVRDLEDVLAILGLTGAPLVARRPPGPPSGSGPPGPPSGSSPPPEGGVEALVLAAVDEEVATPLDRILAASGVDLGGVAIALERLVAGGLLERIPGGYQRGLAARPDGRPRPPQP